MAKNTAYCEENGGRLSGTGDRQLTMNQGMKNKTK
jgi:hypothetical protein